MDDGPKSSGVPGLTLAEIEALQRLEDNPLDAEQVAMFRMFEREDWSHERRRAFLHARAAKRAAASAAE